MIGGHMADPDMEVKFFLIFNIFLIFSILILPFQ